MQPTGNKPLSSNQPILTKSLFENDNRTISEENIQKILNSKIILPDTAKIAVFKYASTSTNRYYSSWWSNEEYLKMQQSYSDTLMAQLKTIPCVQKMILIPSLMISNNPDIFQLREAAVRLQADLLLVFSVNSDIYYKYKMFGKNQAKAFATCEALLLDTRTGIIPHSNVITKEFLLKKGDEDWNEEELMKRAEHGAVIISLIETGKSAGLFLQNNH